MEITDVKYLNDTLDLNRLSAEPESYSIKPEPKCIWVNVWSHSASRHSSEENAVSCSTGAAIVAHKIELPEAP